jgi:hypothetical protein
MAVVFVAATSPVTLASAGNARSAPRSLATIVSEPVLISPPGHAVAEFAAATSPIDPQLLAATAMDNDTTPGPRCAIYVSTDGGSRWSEVPVWPVGSHSGKGGDPWVTIDAQGTIHATCIMPTRPQSVLYSSSHDYGRTWTMPQRVTPLAARLEWADKQALAVDGDGTRYVCFTEDLSDIWSRTLVLSRSTDGVAWTAADTGIDALCNGVAAGPADHITIVFIGEQLTGLAYGTVTSSDGGQHWRSPVFLGSLSTTNFQMPAIAREPSGERIVAALAGSTEQHLELTIESAQGQVQARLPLPAPPSSTCANGRLIQPALTVSPDGGATVQVACKIDASSSADGRMEVWIYRVATSGVSVPIEVSAVALPARAAAHDRFARRFPDGGDYWGLTWTSGGVFSMWIDPRDAGGPGPLLGSLVTD